MPRRAMKALRGGETERLTQNYWTLRAIVLDKHSTDEDIYNSKLNVIPLLNEDELAYSYWELVHMYSRKNISDNIALMKEYLLTEFMDRKYCRGNYGKEGN